MMKKIFFAATVSLFLFGCNMSPNKEARIQELESKVQILEDNNRQLRKKILEFEK